MATVQDVKVVILCGGKGTRLREETEYRPKPMLPIGKHPILWHIMKTYASHGHRHFVLCLGYKGEMIKDFFRNYLWLTSDVTLSLGQSPEVTFHNHHGEEDWTVTMVDTGQETMTGGRIKRIEPYVKDDDHFLLTYGDGVGDLDINESVRFHQRHQKLLTLSAVRPPGRFGEIELDPSNAVVSFNEKPQVTGGWINGGYFVVSRGVFAYLNAAPDLNFEQEPIQHIAKDGQLMAWRHEGFWQPMDTYREYVLLNQLWENGNAPWKIW